jgi:hypothetical protein
VISRRSASGGIEQKIVSCIMIGGSAGLRTMMALPRRAPPMSSTPRAVVLVNSSMFCRVPGPAEGEATLATISAYSTSTTRETAWTIGIVACPPQVISETLSASMR